MDRALKERIIGVTVLVIFAVIIVPIFLNGPSDDTAIISESLVLPGQDSEARKQQTIVLERDRNEPVPAASNQHAAANPPSEEKKTPVPEAVKPVSGPAVPPEATATAPSAPPATTESETGMWAVQLGSFSNQQNAERLAADLRKQGYAAFLSQLKTANGTLQRVRIGPQKDRDSAEAVAAKLKAAGHAVQVVPHP